MFEKGAPPYSGVISTTGSKADPPPIPGDGDVASGACDASPALKAEPLIQYPDLYRPLGTLPGLFSVFPRHVSGRLRGSFHYTPRMRRCDLPEIASASH